MIDYIRELYRLELESGRLSFENDPGYRSTLSQLNQQYEAVWETGDHKLCEQLYSSCFELADDSARTAFCRGMCLGMGLMCCGLRGLSGL